MSPEPLYNFSQLVIHESTLAPNVFYILYGVHIFQWQKASEPCASVLLKRGGIESFLIEKKIGTLDGAITYIKETYGTGIVTYPAEDRRKR